MELPIKLYSATDLHSYAPSYELLFGKLKITTEYQRLASIGDGSSGSVSKARDKSGNIIAMKRLKHSGGVFDREIFREITILRSLDHDNVIKLIELATSSELNLFLILEYCPYSLDKYIDYFKSVPRLIPHDQLKSITKQMFMGLDYLHKNFIAHRDIKPQNLMINQDGILKIIDFGLSRRLIHNNKPMTPHRMTCWYQPPEILFEAPVYGLEVDLWSAGCVLGELFKREPIFPGRSDIDQINLIVEVIGKPTTGVWPKYAECKVYKTIRLKDQPYNKLSEQFQKELGSGEALDLLSQLITYDPKRRISAENCVYHDWLEQAPLPAKKIAIPKELIGGEPNRDIRMIEMDNQNSLRY